MIDILLATYNGEKYIKAQINSLLSQTHKDWRLLIHDDGSTDKTIEIIKEFEKLDSRILLIEDGIKCGGAAANFLYLLKNYAEAEYIIFCDQDDIWLKNKLEVMYERLKKEEGICVVYTNGFLYKNEQVIAQNHIQFHRTNLQDSLFLNGGIHGCCIMFNKPLMEALKQNFPNYVYMHDHLITIFAITFGKMIYIDQALMWYRQHSDNVTGNIPTSFLGRIKTFVDRENPVLEERHYKANEAFYSAFQNKMKDNQKTLFEAYLKYPKVNIIERLKIVWKNKFINGNIFILLLKTFLRKPM